VRFLMDPVGPVFARSLEFLPNLHTLEIWLAGYHPLAPPFRNALSGIKLPQIKALILPPIARTLVKHCPNVEDVYWVIEEQGVTSDESLWSLTSIQDSKIKRLAIPLVSPGNPSRKRSSTP